MDFTQFETTAEGIWRLCPVVDYATKLVLACPVATTQGAADLIVTLAGAVEAAEEMLGRPSSRTAPIQPPARSRRWWSSLPTGRP